MIEFFYSNKTLLSLSLTGCYLNKHKFIVLCDGLNQNSTLQTLILADNELDQEDM